jgi:arylsulfatase A-like enzyme
MLIFTMERSFLGPSAARHVARALCAISLSWITGCADLPREQPAPNVVLISLDALRGDHLSIFGYDRETSPNIDWLADNGVAIRDVVPSGCSTKASLTSLLTSMSLPGHGMFKHGDVLDDQFLTLAETFSKQGYATGGFSATPMILEEFNYQQGFDEFRDFSEKRREQHRILKESARQQGLGSESSEQRRIWKKEAKHIGGDLLADAAINFMNNHDSKEGSPFFLYMHLHEPHPPWIYESPWTSGPESPPRFHSCSGVPSDAEFESFDSLEIQSLIAKYDGAILFADQQIGRLLTELRRVGELDNTVIAVTADHGLELMERYSSGHGFNPFDEVVRIPLVVFDGRNADAFQALRSHEFQARIFDIERPPAWRFRVSMRGSILFQV